ncbi:dihydrodipicolinate synthase family protein [Croceivirga radicis]|uniref:Dihydrodipicolinate synthase family protein n=1 Tax=Croceivirga radicis TaxID=1929488 RepID=A0A1V6LNZ2_9FLAO|nr:dihydrodipicolinate synthase family protein [Croceivirga radicis]OQD41925.1 dihydrodipicolinate synthase family protein [Croceivirga radicis]
MLEWKGVMPAVTTKFTAEDELDLELFNKNITAQITAGVHGIILGGTLGEASTLTKPEKELLLKNTLNTVAGKVPVLLNIAEQTTKDAIAAAQNAEKNGAAGLMLLPPMRYKATDFETVTYFKAIANSTSLPIMIYNNPVDYKIMVTLEMFEDLQSCENIQAIKESTRDITNIIRIKNRFGDRYKVFTGVDTLGMESLAIGADGWVAGLVCAYPAETVAIYELVKAGKLSEALTIYKWFMPLLELDISPQLVQNIKLAELATGIGSEYVRAPRLPLQGKERERVQAIIAKAMENRPMLFNYKSL